MRTALTRRAATGVLAASVMAGAFAKPSGAQNLPAVRIGSSLADDLTPAIYALHAGLFQRAGIDATLQISGSGAALSAAVAGGSIDIAKSTLLGLITAYAHGVRFKVVAGAGVFDATAPTGQLMVLNESPVKAIGADVNGKTIALAALKSLDQLAVQTLIDQHGGTSSTVSFVEMQYTAMLPALQQGRIDIASIATPALETDVATGKVRLLGPQYVAFGTHYMFAAWFCSATYATQNPDVVRRVSDVLRQAAIYTNAHPDDTVSLLSEYTHVDPQLIKKMNRLQSATSVDRVAIQRLIDAAYKYKLIDKPFAATEIS